MSTPHSNRKSDDFKIEPFDSSSNSKDSKSRLRKSAQFSLKPVQNEGSKSNSSRSFENSALDNSREEIISDHLSNTLGVIKLLSAENLNATQTAYIASLKSSCDFLFEGLGLPYPEKFSELPIVEVESVLKNCSTTQNILLVCNHPLQKKILKNLIEKWGYQIQILSLLPSDLDLLSKMEYDLILIAYREENITSTQIKALKKINQDFLVLTNGINTIRSKEKQFPIIEGPIDPDFLNYKMKKILKSQRLKKENFEESA